VTPLGKLGKNSGSGIASRTNQRNPHHYPPASALPLILATSSVATAGQSHATPQFMSVSLRDWVSPY
jgi:hypothetical protein